MRLAAFLAIVVALLFAPLGCVKNYGTPSDGGGDAPTAPTPPPRSHVIEYRVIGSMRPARVSYGNAQDGTTDIDTILPWTAQVRTTKSSMFVFLSATPLDFGTLRVQVFVDGQLFREGSVDDSFILDPVSVSGTVDLTTLIRR